MSRFTRNITLPILPTPGLTNPRLERLRFHAADPANGTPGVPAAPVPAAPAAPAAPAVDPAAAPAPTPPAPAAPPAPAPQPAPTGDLGTAEGQSLIDLIKADPERAEREIRRLRGESGAARTDAKTAAQEAEKAVAEKIGKALGLIKDDASSTDPAALTAAAQEATNKARQAQVELAVFRAVADPKATVKADAAALLDSRTFLTSLDGLDPAAADFQEKLGAAIKTAVEANPKLAAQEAAPTPPRRTAIDTGGTGERRTTAQPSSLTAAIGAAYAQQ